WRQPSWAYDAARGRAVLFGGDAGPAGSFGDTWEWDGATWALASNSGPSARINAAMAYDAARQRTLLFGGTTPARQLSDLWEWDGVAWLQRAASGPGPLVYPQMAFDP